MNKVTEITEKLATAEADEAKKKGIRVYTVAIGSGLKLEARMADRSSECPVRNLEWDSQMVAYDEDPVTCSNIPQYAYSGTDVENMYQAIIDSIINLNVSVGPKISTITPGTGKTIALPDDFTCQAGSQDFPLVITTGSSGEVRMSNVEFDICQP